MCQPDPQEMGTCPEEAPSKGASQEAETAQVGDDAACVCQSMCEKLKQKLKEVDMQEVFETTMDGVRKRPLLGVLVAAFIGYFLGRLSKKFS